MSDAILCWYWRFLRRAGHAYVTPRVGGAYKPQLYLDGIKTEDISILASKISKASVAWLFPTHVGRAGDGQIQRNFGAFCAVL